MLPSKKESPIIGLAGAGGGIGSYIFLSSDGGYVISRSLRFSSGDSSYLNRTPSSAGNRRTYTWSGWVKRSALGSGTYYFLTAVDSPNADILGVEADSLYWYNAYSGAVTSTDKFRDPSAWYHIIFAVDSTQLTDSNRVKMYANGRQITSFSSTLWPSLNRDFAINAGVAHQMGRYFTTSGSNFYLADINFIDGQALTPSDFGEYDDNNVWQPIEYSGSYGTNGFHLDFSDTSSDAALGTDTSGNSNTWTVNNLTAASGVGPGITTTVPEDLTGNWTGIIGIVPTDTSGAVAVFPDGFGTGSTKGTFFWSGLTVGDTITWYGTASGQTRSVVGNVNETSVSVPGGSLGSFQLTVSAASGSAKVDFNGTANCYGITPGPVSSEYNDALRDSPSQIADQTDTGVGGEVVGNYATLNPLWNNGHVLSNGNLDYAPPSPAAWTSVLSTFGMSSGKWYWEQTYISGSANCMAGFGNSSSTLISYPTSPNSLGYDFVDGYIYGANAGAQGATLSAGDIMGIALDVDAGTADFYKNGVKQGSTLTHGITGTLFPLVSSYDGVGCVNFGQRAFAYSAPSGYKCLNTANLSDPLIADGSTAFDAVTYAGNGGTQSITNYNFSPSFVWIKDRTSTGSHVLQDTVRGTDSYLMSNETAAENNSTNYVTSFNADGFSIGNGNRVNNGSRNYVAWAWDAGEATTTIAAGSLNSSLYDQSQTWSTYLTFSTDGGGFLSGRSPADVAFDGTRVENAATNTTGTSAYIEVSGLSLTASDLLEVTLLTSSPGSLSWSVTGTNVTTTSISTNADQFVTIPITGSATGFRVTSTSSGRSHLTAIRINGKELVDPTVLTPSIASTVRANPSAGFSIISYTGNGTAGATVGHGLNATPSLVMYKNRDSSTNFEVQAFGTIRFDLNQTVANQGNNLTTFTNSTFSLASSSIARNASGSDYIAYCFAPVSAYSSFGVYTGNGSASDGPFVFLDFAPAFLLVKRTDSTGNWILVDQTRGEDKAVYPNQNISEASASFIWVDFVSNGFKIRSSIGAVNASGGDYIYWAVAEIPQKYSRAR